MSSHLQLCEISHCHPTTKACGGPCRFRSVTSIVRVFMAKPPCLHVHSTKVCSSPKLSLGSKSRSRYYRQSDSQARRIRQPLATPLLVACLPPTFAPAFLHCGCPHRSSSCVTGSAGLPVPGVSCAATLPAARLGSDRPADTDRLVPRPPARLTPPPPPRLRRQRKSTASRECYAGDESSAQISTTTSHSKPAAAAGSSTDGDYQLVQHEVLCSLTNQVSFPTSWFSTRCSAALPTR